MVVREVWIGAVRTAAGQDLLCAAMARDAEEVAQLAASACTAGGADLQEVLRAHRFTDWVRQVGDSDRVQDLALRVMRDPPVILDIRETDAVPAVQREDIMDVTPLDAQFGIHPRRDVPDVFLPALFEGPAACHAVIDGARIGALGDRLASAGIEHASLIGPNPSAEVIEAGPWIALMEPGSAILRQLFTDLKGDQDWAFWSAGPAIYIRSRLTTAELRAHLRRFVRVQGADGMWMMFRFWDPQVMRHYLMGIADWEARLRNWFETVEGGRLEAIITPCPAGPSSVFRLNAAGLSDPAPPRLAFRLTDRDRTPLRDLARSRRLDAMSGDLRRLFPKEIGARPAGAVEAAVRLTADRLAPHGITHAGDLMRFAAWDLLYGHGFESQDRTGTLTSILAGPNTGRDKFARFSDAFMQLTGSQ
ncbi:MAG: DUF4123 domain-containing protein [Pseudomonadota bacterium]